MTWLNICSYDFLIWANFPIFKLKFFLFFLYFWAQHFINMTLRIFFQVKERSILLDFFAWIFRGVYPRGSCWTEFSKSSSWNNFQISYLWTCNFCFIIFHLYFNSIQSYPIVECEAIIFLIISWCISNTFWY